jgi:hypothetical protein
MIKIKDNNIYYKSRLWIKSHFFSGFFYGLCFGSGSLFFFSMGITQKSIPLLGYALFLMILGILSIDFLEDNSFHSSWNNHNNNNNNNNKNDQI